MRRKGDKSRTLACLQIVLQGCSRFEYFSIRRNNCLSSICSWQPRIVFSKRSIVEVISTALSSFLVCPTCNKCHPSGFIDPQKPARAAWTLNLIGYSSAHSQCDWAGGFIQACYRKNNSYEEWNLKYIRVLLHIRTQDKNSCINFIKGYFNQNSFNETTLHRSNNYAKFSFKVRLSVMS